MESSFYVSADKVEIDSNAREKFPFMAILRHDFQVIQSTTCIRVVTGKQTAWQSCRLLHLGDTTDADSFELVFIQSAMQEVRDLR